jgi:DNA replication protein DnaC
MIFPLLRMTHDNKFPKACQEPCDIIGDATIADAIYDRIIHTSHKIEIKGESIRKGKSNNSG